MNSRDKKLEAVNKQISDTEKEVSERSNSEEVRAAARKTLVELRDKRYLMARK